MGSGCYENGLTGMDDPEFLESGGFICIMVLGVRLSDLSHFV